MDELSRLGIDYDVIPGVSSFLATAAALKKMCIRDRCTNEELYYALLTLTKKMASGKQHGNSKKKLYYISAEFLIGKLLSNNLINLGIYDEVKEELAQNGKNICEIEEFEKEPSLGNGAVSYTHLDVYKRQT